MSPEVLNKVHVYIFKIPHVQVHDIELVYGHRTAIILLYRTARTMSVSKSSRTCALHVHKPVHKFATMRLSAYDM